MKITYAVVTRNDATRLQRTLDSVVKNSNPAITEIVVIDGNSTDFTDKVMSDYADYVDKYEKQKEKGIYNAMNQAWEISSGDYINFLNCGDLLISQPKPDELRRGYATSFKTKGLKRGYLPLWIRNSIPHHSLYYCRTLAINYDENLICCADYMETIRLKKNGKLRLSDRVTTFVENPKESGSGNSQNYLEASKRCRRVGGLYRIAALYYYIGYLLSVLGFRWRVRS